MDASAAMPRLYLDAALKPRRSLSRRGVMLLMIPVVFVNLVFAVFLLAIGAVLVPPFLGLDVLGLGLGLWFSFRQARRIERVQVSADLIEVSSEVGAKHRAIWTSAPQFTRVEFERPGRHSSRLRLWSKGRGVTLASALGPVEREAFAVDLESAISAARAERW